MVYVDSSRSTAAKLVIPALRKNALIGFYDSLTWALCRSRLSLYTPLLPGNCRDYYASQTQFASILLTGVLVP